jgi:hypothetical protein
MKSKRLLEIGPYPRKRRNISFRERKPEELKLNSKRN